MTRAKYPCVLAPLLLCLVLVTNAVSAKEPVITGAGAHFSWVVFDELKPKLEKELGRELKLFGRESMLGAGCNAGIKSAKQHSAEKESFGFVCCPLSKAEIEKNKIQLHPLALEPVLILVNKENPVENLSVEQARGIFSGEIKNWKELGGDDAPIVVVTRLHCKKRPGHWKTILDNEKKFTSKRLNVQSAADMINRMNDFKTAIGHTGAVWKFDSNDNVKSVTINGYAPTASNLKEGKYPFYRMLSAVISEEAEGDVPRLMALTRKLLLESDVVNQYSILPYSEENAHLFKNQAEASGSGS